MKLLPAELQDTDRLLLVFHYLRQIWCLRKELLSLGSC